MIEFGPGVLAQAQDAIEHLRNKGRQKAMYRLMGAGFAIAQLTQDLGTGRHGQLLGKPRVRQVDDETVSVGFKVVRAHVRSRCWRRTWRSPRRRNGRVRCEGDRIWRWNC